MKYRQPGCTHMPLSGGKLTCQFSFAGDNYCSFNGHGEALSVGETFSSK